MCRRTESQAGKMITLPGGLQVCQDCMQRSFDMMMGSGMDWTKMSGITPELLKKYVSESDGKRRWSAEAGEYRNCCG